MKRIEFIKKAGISMLVTLPALTHVACSDENDNPVPGPGNNLDPNCLENGTKTTIGSNHGHSLVVSINDINAGTEKIYSIQGTSGHNHEVTLTSDNFQSLKDNNSITVSSTNDDGHIHSVTVTCA